MSDSSQSRGFPAPFIKGQVLSAERMNRLQELAVGRTETDDGTEGPRVFELAEALEPGEDADAYVLYYSRYGEQWKRFKKSDGTYYKFIVSDPTGKVTGAEGDKGICVRSKQAGMWIIPTAATGLVVARVSTKIPRNGIGRAYPLEWNPASNEYEEPAEKKYIDVYDVLTNYGLGPVDPEHDIFVQLGNSGKYELVQVTCPQESP